MRYLFKMISTRPFPIDLALIHLRHNPEGPWHPPDTQQTPNWHLTDSLKCMFFWPKTGHCEKSQYMVKWYLQVCFQWIWHQYTSNTTQSVQDTLQTANRHFQTAINTQFSVFKHVFVCFKLFTTMMYFILEHNICTLLTQFLKAPLEHSGWTRWTRWEWRWSHSLRGTAAPPCQRQTPSSEWW